MSDEVRAVLDFWFNEDAKSRWFAPSAAFDQAVAEQLGEGHQRAAAGAFDGWQSSAEGCVALCILLDQVPRQLFRGQARAFATDDRALAVARHALDAGFDRQLTVEQRQFLYMPFMHSERLEDQDRCVALYEAPELRDKLEHAVEHAELVRRFGRFPHRNMALGRASSAEEEDHLAQTARHFGQAAVQDDAGDEPAQP
jgi:uncharacterized protein (DUF924 family)